MIWRVGGAAAAAVPVVAQAAGVEVSKPVQWDVLGYHFGAAGMIAALFACLCTRWWHGSAQAARKEYRWKLDAPITAMTLLATTAAVMATNPEPWWALVTGAGIGAVGEGLFKICERMLRASGMLSAPDNPPTH